MFGKNHVIHYDGAPPRLAYHIEPEGIHPSMIQELPSPEDHPENPANTPTLSMNRPKLLSTMRFKRRKNLEAAATRGEPHAVLKLKKVIKEEKDQLLKEKRRRALRKSIFMAKMDRFAKNDQIIRNRDKQDSGGQPHLHAHRLHARQQRRLDRRAFVYREWDEYRDHHTLVKADVTAGHNVKKLRRAMDHHDSYVEEHAVLWTPRTQKDVLTEERMVKDVLSGADVKMKRRFRDYKPAVSHGDVKKSINIKRAGERYLEGLKMMRENSVEDGGGDGGGDAGESEEEEREEEEEEEIDYDDMNPELVERLRCGVVLDCVRPDIALALRAAQKRNMYVQLGS